MAPQVFYRKWRPQTLAEVVGQEPVTQTLRNAVSTGRISHAYLFSGPRGTGKTSTARILAKAVNCLNPSNGEPCDACSMCQTITEARAMDIIEIDAASNNGVDDIRSLREKVGYAPNQARYKVYIIDEVHMLSNSASNALLKTLEEPPPHVIFILATTEAHKILPTILSRCQRFDFRRLTQTDVISKLGTICSAEGIHIAPEALRLVARSATGSLRDAENLLEQLTTYYGAEIGLEQVQATLGITGDWRAKELVKHIINNDIAAGMTMISGVNGDGLDLRQFNRELVAYLRALLLIKAGSAEAVDLSAEDIAELKALAAKASLEQILRATKLFGQLELGLDNYSALPLELALVDCTLTSEEERKVQPRQTEAELRPPPKAATPPPAPAQSRPPPAKPAPAKVTAPPAPVMAATVTTPLQGGTEIERLRLNWKQVIELAPQDTRKTSAIAILRSAGVKPTSIENDTVVLSFRHNNHKELIEKLENQRVVEKIISNFLGRPCRVQCILEDNHLLKEALKIGRIIDVEEK
ncbi:MAG: DNA polymerase III subunit gamma/tau [Dehalococcoidales bacterium]|nr:DNA polymerase III subunit gamma/tau [Dehalococcoidales bacterium]